MATKHPINASLRPSKCCTTKLSLEGRRRSRRDNVSSSQPKDGNTEAFRRHLTRRFRSAQAFAVEPGAIETTCPSLPGPEHRARSIDSARTCLRLLRGGDPVNPIPARDRGDVRPHRPCLRARRRQSFAQGSWYLRFWFLCHRRDLQGDHLARLSARRFAQLPVHFEPVTFLAVRLERGRERGAIDRTLNRRHTPRRYLRTGGLAQG